MQRDGLWAWLRLLEAGRLISEPDGKDFTMEWHLPALGTAVTVDFKPARSESPFLGARNGGPRRLLEVFRAPGVNPPASISKGFAACDSPQGLHASSP